MNINYHIEQAWVKFKDINPSIQRKIIAGAYFGLGLVVGILIGWFTS